MLSHITIGDNLQVLGALNVLATLLQTKGEIITDIQLCSSVLLFLSCISIFFVELDESMLDALGILPQRKQHKKLLLVLFHDDYAAIFWTLFTIDSMTLSNKHCNFWAYFCFLDTK